MRIEPASMEHAEAVAALCEREGWERWADRDRTREALSAPGARSLVALEGGEVVGAAHAVSDGPITTYLGMLVVATSHRGRGIGRALVCELFSRWGFARMDLLAADESVAFYERWSHQVFRGFRLYPETA
jgi:ribosomal protein S18 acetylase RimI-like enzyme